MKCSFVFFVFLCGVVVQAAEKYCPGQEEERALRGSIAKRLEDCFEDSTSVWVMVVRKGERYTGLYDVRQEKVCLSWGFDGDYAHMIFPVMDYLKNEALRGYEQRGLCGPQTDFSKDLECVGGSLNKLRYKRCAFLSQSIRIFLTDLCSKIAKKGKVMEDCCGKRLTDDVLQSLEPSEDQWLRFVIQDKESALVDMLSAREYHPTKVFMTLPGFGVVRGCAISRVFCRYSRELTLPRECFLFHKMNALRSAMIRHYPFDEKTWKTCLNYEGA